MGSERMKPCSPTGGLAVSHLLVREPDLVVLTEAWIDHLGDGFHHADAGVTQNQTELS